MYWKTFLFLVSFGTAMAQVEIDVPAPIQLNQDDFVITCRVTGSVTNIFGFIISKRFNESIGYMEIIRQTFIVLESGSILNTTWADTDVQERAFLSGTALPAPQATLTLTIPNENVSCERDSADYICQATTSPPSSNPISEPKDVVIITPSAAPYNIEPENEESIEGEVTSFKCQAVLTVAIARLRWWIYRNGETSAREIMDNVTLSAHEESSCFRNTTSNLMVAFTREDNGAVVRCSVYHPFLTSPSGRPEDNPHIESSMLNVFYRIGSPTVTRQPERRTYETGGSLVLTCAADGNPNPSFDWFLRPIDGGSENSATSISGIQATDNRLSIGNLALFHSGIFICETRNEFNNVTYRERTEVEILIIEKVSSNAAIIVGAFFGGLAAGVLIVTGIVLLNKKIGLLSKLSNVCKKSGKGRIANNDGMKSSNIENENMNFGNGVVENGAPPTRSTYVESG